MSFPHPNSLSLIRAAGGREEEAQRGEGQWVNFESASGSVRQVSPQSSPVLFSPAVAICFSIAPGCPPCLLRLC